MNSTSTIQPDLPWPGAKPARTIRLLRKHTQGKRLNSDLISAPPEWLSAIPALAEIQDERWLEALRQTKVLSLPANSVAFRQDDPCLAFLMLLEGSLRVQQVSNQGRAVMLYRVSAGQACVMTVAGLMAGRTYAAEGIAEMAVKVALMPRASFLAALQGVSALQDIIFGHFCDKLNHMMGMFKQMAFGSVEVRLARLVYETASIDDILLTTHDRLAQELGTDRAVVTRALKELETQGLLQCCRGQLNISKPELSTYLFHHPL
jgi:CRP/FNR family transcriptional regulator